MVTLCKKNVFLIVKSCKDDIKISLLFLCRLAIRNWADAPGCIPTCNHIFILTVGAQNIAPLQLGCSFLLPGWSRERFPVPPHANHTDDDERNGEQLPHIEEHLLLKGFLYVLGVLDEEAEREDKGKAEAEKEASAYPLFVLLIEVPAYKEEEEVGDGLVKLARMAWLQVHTGEDKGPRHIGHLADNLRIHEISQSDEAGCNGRGDSYIVEHLP